jgi:hypothetical protein
MLKGADGTTWGGRIHHLTAFVQPDTTVVGSGNAALGIFLLNPGALYAASARLWDTVAYTTPRATLVWELYPDESRKFALYTAPGDGVTIGVRTELTGINPPSGVIAPYTHRLELIYNPGQYIAALVDGVEGARVSTGLPSTTYHPLGSVGLSGIGAYSGFDSSSQAMGQFGGIMFETSFP